MYGNKVFYFKRAIKCPRQAFGNYKVGANYEFRGVISAAAMGALGPTILKNRLITPAFLDILVLWEKIAGAT